MSDTTERDKLAGTIRAVTDLWDEPLDEVHDIPPIVNAILAEYLPEHDRRVRREAAAEAHREGYRTALADVQSGAFISGPAWSARDFIEREAAAEQREKDAAAVIAAAPPVNAELNLITGAEDDPGMSGYVEGFRDAYAAIREQGTVSEPSDSEGQS